MVRMEGVSCNYYSAGGGSGGSIYIETGTIAGSGSMTAAGGNYGGSCSYAIGGGGAGGRIAIHYSSSTYSGSMTAYGGSGNQYGGGGNYIHEITVPV